MNIDDRGVDRMSYWYAPGMQYPYWCTYEGEDYPKEGEATMVAHNLDTDTDMGDLYANEFFTYFPHAFEISEAQVGNIHPDDGLAWAMLLKALR